MRGDGKRKLAVFEDPNCGYCKRFEADLQKVNNVTIHMFLYPILSKDSTDKSKNIWCAKDKARAWNDWMLRDVQPAAASCDAAALTRNVEFRGPLAPRRWKSSSPKPNPERRHTEGVRPVPESA